MFLPGPTSPPVVTGHVVDVMPAELGGHGIRPGPGVHPHPMHHHPMHHPMHPPCGPGPSYAAPGSFLLSIQSAKDLYDLEPRPMWIWMWRSNAYNRAETVRASKKRRGELCFLFLCQDWTGKMDPYVIVRTAAREFRTPVMTNAGKKPKFNWAQLVDWHGEPDIHFLVMDSNVMVADGLIGEAVYKGLPLHSDFKGLPKFIQIPRVSKSYPWNLLFRWQPQRVLSMERDIATSRNSRVGPQTHLWRCSKSWQAEDWNPMAKTWHWTWFFGQKSLKTKQLFLFVFCSFCVFCFQLKLWQT